MTIRHGHGGISPLLIARHGGVLRVLGVARISTDHQDERSLADQEALYRKWLDDHFEGPYELTMIASRGSGERLDRAELGQLDELIASKSVDLIITEDLGRIVRRMHAFIICEECEDTGTRLIALNDNVDTAREDWRLHTLFASMRHESYNRDTAKRIRRSLRSRFMQGNVLRVSLCCYDKPNGAKHDSQVFKRPEWVAILEEIVRRLEDGANYSEVADWLNAEKIPPGPGSRGKRRWNGGAVRNLVHNNLLKGIRTRNRKISMRVNRTGRRKSVDAPPDDLLVREVPHLAFFDANRYDRLIETLRQRNEKYNVAKKEQNDPRKGRPKKRTVWPGQQVFCGICHRAMVYGGHGQPTHLVCQGAKAYECWNCVTFDGVFGGQQMSREIFAAIALLPDFDETLTRLMHEEVLKLNSDRDARRARLEQDHAKIERERDNVVRAIRELGHSDFLIDEVRRLESALASTHGQQLDLDAENKLPLQLEPVAELRRQALEEFQALTVSSPEFGRLISKIVPKIIAYPVRLCDGGHPGLRAEFTVSLAALVPSTCRTQSVVEHLQRRIVVDLFEMPQRAIFREQVVSLCASGKKERQIAASLEITQPAVQRAKKLDRLMKDNGLVDPYVRIFEPPSDYGRMRRHLHPRYRFNPLPNPDES